jgi:hypothetical protein
MEGTHYTNYRKKQCCGSMKFWYGYRMRIRGSRPLTSALQRQNTEISKQIFPEKEYRGLSPNFHIHASVSDLYIPTIGLPIFLEEICRPVLGLYKSLSGT